MTYPREVRIIASKNEWSHHYPVGTIVKLTSDDGDVVWDRAYQSEGVNHAGRTIPQRIMAADFEELVQSEEQKEVAARVKYLYSVQDADGMAIVNTRDRECAREVKSLMGGRKEGVVIIAYAPVKEIR